MQRFSNIRARAAAMSLECVSGLYITGDYASLSASSCTGPLDSRITTHNLAYQETRNQPMRFEFLGETDSGCKHAVCQLLTGLRLLEQWDRAEAASLGHLEPSTGEVPPA